MAHELSHVKHRDVLIMTIASFFASLAAIITQFGFFFGGDSDDNPSFIIVLLVSFAVYIISFFLMMALSRYREYGADRGAAIDHRPPERARLRAVEDLGRDGARAHSQICARPSG